MSLADYVVILPDGRLKLCHWGNYLAGEMMPLDEANAICAGKWVILDKPSK
jgi:hypothetical protein